MLERMRQLRKNIWSKYKDNELKKIDRVSSKYKTFLNDSKTERECVDTIIRLARENGYLSINEFRDKKLDVGSKVYYEYMNKAVILYYIGDNYLDNGLNMIVSHVDSPRMDLKQNPIYEKDNFVYLDTHYYGGIKKYQWVTVPLALHGVIIKKDGTKVNISIGEKEDEPVFYISDLLIHLSSEQLKKEAKWVIDADNLDVIIGNKVVDDNEDMKFNILNILKSRYDVEEDDFVSAEIELVPAYKARDCGIDSSMIASYGQDDRICCFASLEAMLNKNIPKDTCCCIFVDKEEVGSIGATGMKSRLIENATLEIMRLLGNNNYSDMQFILNNSRMICADVTAAYDPLYSNVFEKNNTAFLGCGVVISKYAGHGGKYSTNDANAEYVAFFRKLFSDNNITYQASENGRVDYGGGGTISYIASLYGMNVIDIGVSILSMHSPCEVSSKVDIYELIKAYRVFLDNAGDYNEYR